MKRVLSRALFGVALPALSLLAPGNALPEEPRPQDGIVASSTPSDAERSSAGAIGDTAPVLASNTSIEANGTSWRINGQDVQLWGVRTANALYDDTSTQRLVIQLDNWKAHGIRAVSISLQGARTGDGSNADEAFACFESTGALKLECKSRLTTILAALDDRAMVAQLVLFYQGGDQVVTIDNVANLELFHAIDEVAAWIETQNHTNVFVDIANEHGHAGFDHGILTESAGDSGRTALCDRWRVTSDLLCSVSLGIGHGAFTYDYQIWHGNDNSSGGMIPSTTKPGVTNEIDRFDAYDEPGEFTDAEIADVLSWVVDAKADGYGWFFHSAWTQGTWESGTEVGSRFHLGSAVAGAQPSTTDSDRSVDWAFDSIATREGLSPDSESYYRTDGDDVNCLGDHNAPYVTGSGSAQTCAYERTTTPGPAGRVPDGSTGTPLRLARGTGGDVELSWSASCSAADNDYAVYEGNIGSFASHAPRVCSTGGSTSATLSPDLGSTYYLVVPLRESVEGSYGRSSSGAERPAARAACLPQETGACALAAR